MGRLSRRDFIATATLAAGAAAVPSSSALNTGSIGWPYASATAAAAAIRERRISSLELAELMLDRIGKLNPKLNTFAMITADSALARAREADTALAKGELWGPLHGLPCTIKDAFETAGVRTTSGASFLKDYIPQQDAAAVSRMRKAGMVMLGKTNLPFMAGDWQSYNDLFGTTNNPWNVARTPGGSSGGAAASLAAGMQYLGLGSDIGGSIRVPAHFCGVFGHKPTYGLVSMRGHVPPPPGVPYTQMDLAVAGPLARSADDLLLALQVLAAPADGDSVAFKWTLPPPRRKSIAEYRIGYALDHPLCPTTPEVRQRLQAAVDALRAEDARLEEGFPKSIDVREQYFTYLVLLMVVDGADASEEEVARLRSSQPAEQDLFGAARKEAAGISYQRWRSFDARRLAARSAWQSYFGQYDAFLMPADFVTAFPHDHSPNFAERVLHTSGGARRYIDQLFWPGFATMTGLPATVAPVGLASDGLPVGIQIMGPWMEEATPIAVAQALEKAFPFKVPKGYE